MSLKPKLIELRRYFRFRNDFAQPSKNQPSFQTLIRLTDLKMFPSYKRMFGSVIVEYKKRFLPQVCTEMYLTCTILITVKVVVKTHGNSPRLFKILNRGNSNCMIVHCKQVEKIQYRLRYSKKSIELKREREHFFY